jgi:hypothetical protein
MFKDTLQEDIVYCVSEQIPCKLFRITDKFIYVQRHSLSLNSGTYECKVNKETGYDRLRNQYYEPYNEKNKILYATKLKRIEINTRLNNISSGLDKLNLNELIKLEEVLNTCGI